MTQHPYQISKKQLRGFRCEKRAQSLLHQKNGLVVSVCVCVCARVCVCVFFSFPGPGVQAVFWEADSFRNSVVAQCPGLLAFWGVEGVG